MRFTTGALHILRAAALVLALVGATARAGEAVRVENASRPTRCAEDDNVTVKLWGAGVRSFTVTATLPAYAADIRTDSKAPDFSHCDQSHDPSYRFTPRDVTLYEDSHWILMGHTYPTFWRPERLPFRVGARVTSGLHLVQLIHKSGRSRSEALVLYPSDGYWRAKPLAPDGAAENAYGSSFLVGPVEMQGRPFVRIRRVAFDPKRLEFTLALGTGTATVRVIEASTRATRVRVTLPPSDGKTPFAALRSMYVSPEMADTAETILDPGRRVLPVLAPLDARAKAATFARSRPSRHNTSAPDLRFGDFSRWATASPRSHGAHEGE